ncbi:hypothetical protein D9M71_839750 [compost metagenome]
MLAKNSRAPRGARLPASSLTTIVGTPPGACSLPTNRGSGQHGHQGTLAVQFGQVVEAADVRVAEENLRHAAPAAATEHFFEFAGRALNVDLLRCHAFAGQ